MATQPLGVKMALNLAWAGVLLPLCFFSASIFAQSLAEEKPVSQQTSGQVSLHSESSEVRELSDVNSVIQSIGIAGVWKLGHPCTVAVRIPCSLDVESNSDDSSLIPSVVEVTTVDGDAVEVKYVRKIENAERDRFKADKDHRLAIPVRIGRAPSMVSATLLDDDGKVVERQDYTLPPGSGLSPTQPFVVTIGGKMGLDDLVRTSADGSLESITVVNIIQAVDIPSTLLEYSPVDLVVLSTSSIELMEQIGDKQWAALDSFIRNGGACVITLGASGEELRRVPRLLDMLPGSLEEQGIIRNPAALESMVTTDQAIQPFPATIWQAQHGLTKLTLSDSLGQPTAWWVSVPRGFGTIQIIASDLGHPSFNAWKHRRLLWERLVAPYFDKADLESVKSASDSGTDSYLGYNDLTGQLRASLDQFDGVRVVTFSQIAAVLVALVILIGPMDYFVSVRWLKCPQFSWFFTGAILSFVTLALIWGYRQMRPDQILVNTVAILDVDSQTGRATGHQWSHLYSSKARRVSVQANSIFSDAPVRLDWQGLPGAGLGGLQSTMRFGRGMPAYQIELSSDGGSRFVDLGIAAAGTKSLYATWIEHLPVSASGVNAVERIVDTLGKTANKQLDDQPLRELATVDQLEGIVINPLNVDLRDAAVFYHRWYYALKSRMPAGDRVMLSSQIIPRDISRKLIKQQEMDGKLTSARWDPADRDQLDRLLELMMFHKAATGKNYTSLTHRFQPIIDHSNLLETNYAILVGRLDTPPLDLKIDTASDGEAVGSEGNVQTGISRTWVRFLLPVITNK